MRIALTAFLIASAVFGGGYGLGRATAEDEVFTEQVPEWEVIGISSDERTLTIRYQTGDPACHSQIVRSHESPSAVRLRVLVRRHLEGTWASGCTDVGITKTEAIDLQEPLGLRPLIDATTGRKQGVLICSPTSNAPGCAAGAEIGIAYPMRLRPYCGVVVAYLDGRWWETERPRPDPLNTDYGDPVFFGWQWEAGAEGTQEPYAVRWQRTAYDDFTVPGTMTLVSSTRAVFEREDLRDVRFFPLRRLPQCEDRWGR